MTTQLGTIETRGRLRPLPKLGRASTGWPPVQAALIGLDTLGLAAAFGGAYLLRFTAGLPVFQTVPYSVGFYASVLFWALPVWLALFALNRLYDRRFIFEGFQEYVRIATACTAGLLAIIVISYFYDLPTISRAWLLVVWTLAILYVGGLRFTARRLVRLLRRRGYLVARTLVVGANEEGQALAAQLLGDPGGGARVIGFVDRGDEVLAGASQVPVLGALGDLGELVERLGVSELVVASTALQREELLDLYRRFGHDDRVELRLSTGLIEILTTGVRVQEISGVPLMTPQRVRITGVDAFLKSVLDYLGAVAGLLLLGPLFALIALLIRLDGGPVLYRRRVLGRNGKPFDAFKFCTMIADRRSGADRRGGARPGTNDRRQTDKAPTDPRVTRVGAILRRTSLDELPQLINVLRGEMSLIGPRMITPAEAARYGKWQLNLLTVKPGITGPWQVAGRAEIPYEERIRLSMDYIRDYSIWLDLEILLRTIPVVLRGRGAF